MPLGKKPFENTVGKGEIAHNEQFLLFPHCFLPVWITFCHFRQILNCRLQTPSVWKSLKFVVWLWVKSTGPRPVGSCNCPVSILYLCVDSYFKHLLYNCSLVLFFNFEHRNDPAMALFRNTLKFFIPIKALVAMGTRLKDIENL